MDNNSENKYNFYMNDQMNNEIDNDIDDIVNITYDRICEYKNIDVILDEYIKRLKDKIHSQIPTYNSNDNDKNIDVQFSECSYIYHVIGDTQKLFAFRILIKAINNDNDEYNFKYIISGFNKSFTTQFKTIEFYDRDNGLDEMIIREVYKCAKMNNDLQMISFVNSFGNKYGIFIYPDKNQ